MALGGRGMSQQVVVGQWKVEVCGREEGTSLWGLKYVIRG